MLTSQVCTRIENTSGQGDFSVSNKAIVTSTPFKKLNSISANTFGAFTKSICEAKKLSDANERCHETLKEKHPEKSLEEVNFENFERERKTKCVNDINILKDTTLLNFNRNFSTPTTKVKPLETKQNQNAFFNSFNTLQKAPFISLQSTKEPLLDPNEISLIATPFIFTEKSPKMKAISKKNEQNKMLPFFNFMYRKNLPLVLRSTNKLEMKIREPIKKTVQMELKKHSKSKMSGNNLIVIPSVVIQTHDRGVQTDPEVKLNRVEYYTLPLLEELHKYKNPQGRYIVPEFTIGRAGYGNIHFPGETDVTDLNLDEIVHISHKHVTVYPDKTKKPPLGQGLNRPAQITLYKIWPLDKNQTPIKIPDEHLKRDFTNSLKNTCNLQGAVFESYEFLTGIWIYTVPHI